MKRNQFILPSYILCSILTIFPSCGGSADVSIMEGENIEIEVVGAEIDNDSNSAAGVGVQAEADGGVKFTYAKIIIYVDRNGNGKCDDGEEKMSGTYDDPSGSDSLFWVGAEFEYNREKDGPIKYETEIKTNTGASAKSKGNLYN